MIDHQRPYAGSQRPANYAELGQMILDTGDLRRSWSEFVHEFYRYRVASFFVERPPAILIPSWQAILAGTAAFLSQEFGVAVPKWVNDPQGMNRSRAYIKCKVKCKVVSETRNLIAL